MHPASASPNATIKAPHFRNSRVIAYLRYRPQPRSGARLRHRRLARPAIVIFYIGRREYREKACAAATSFTAA